MAYIVAKVKVIYLVWPLHCLFQWPNLWRGDDVPQAPSVGKDKDRDGVPHGHAGQMISGRNPRQVRDSMPDRQPRWYSEGGFSPKIEKLDGLAAVRYTPQGRHALQLREKCLYGGRFHGPGERQHLYVGAEEGVAFKEYADRIAPFKPSDTGAEQTWLAVTGDFVSLGDQEARERACVSLEQITSRTNQKDEEVRYELANAAIEMGLDGIIYPSALVVGKLNVVIFSYSVANAVQIIVRRRVTFD